MTDAMVGSGPSAADVDPAVIAKFEKSLLRAAGAVLAAGLVAVICYVLPHGLQDAVRIVGAAVATAGVAGAVGGALGFLFGIPKTLQSDQLDGKPIRYLANTNLEDISDWLTKIIVGVGLIQIARLPSALQELGDWLAPLFGGSEHSPAFAVMYAGYFAVASFLLVYLWTRSRLRGVLQAADADLTQRIEVALTQREDANALALSLVERQLTGNNPPTQAELDQAIAAATPDWLVLIFRRAEDQRAKTWATDKVEMARTIPVFRALVANDKELRYFRHFASLGFALKDSEPPAYAEAVVLLSRAIEIRGRARKGNYDLLEWNRAVCRIQLDPQFARGAVTGAELKQSITADLRVSAALPDRFFSTDREVGRWMALNNVTL